MPKLITIGLLLTNRLENLTWLKRTKRELKSLAIKLDPDRSAASEDHLAELKFEVASSNFCKTRDLSITSGNTIG